MQPVSEDFQESFDRLIVESLQNGCIWALRDQQGNWAMVDSDVVADVPVIPFWSDEKMAASLCNQEWTIYQPVAIAIEEFLDDWLVGMHQDVIRAGINWNQDLEGQEVEPLDLLEEFEAELE